MLKVRFKKGKTRSKRGSIKHKTKLNMFKRVQMMSKIKLRILRVKRRAKPKTFSKRQKAKHKKFKAK